MRRQERNLASPPSKLTRLPSTIDIGYGGEIAVNLIFGIGRQRCGTCLESGTAPSAESRDLPDVARASVGAPHVRGDIPTPFGRRVFFPLPPSLPPSSFSASSLDINFEFCDSRFCLSAERGHSWHHGGDSRPTDIQDDHNGVLSRTKLLRQNDIT